MLDQLRHTSVYAYDIENCFEHNGVFFARFRFALAVVPTAT